MNTDEIRSRAEAIVDLLPEVDGAELRNRTLRDNLFLHDQLQQALARVAVLTASDSLLFADARVQVSNYKTAEGHLLVATDRGLVVAELDPTGSNDRNAATVEFVPWSALQRVAVVEMYSNPEPEQWPSHLQLRLDLDREVCGQSSVTVPRHRLADADRAQALLEIAQRIK